MPDGDTLSQTPFESYMETCTEEATLDIRAAQVIDPVVGKVIQYFKTGKRPQ